MMQIHFPVYCVQTVWQQQFAPNDGEKALIQC